MKLRDPRLWITFFSVFAITLMGLSYVGRESPGEVTTVHAREGDLNEGKTCAGCHGGWFSSIRNACLDCHEDIDNQLGNGHGLHGVLGESRASQCALCHSEHKGRGFPLVNRQSFAAAGIPDPAKFDHEFIGFAMAGKHLEQECSKCHEHADVEVLPEGAKRYLGLERNCVSCHEDSHEGQMELACASCHGQESFTELASLGHEDHLHLVGGHAEVACLECHSEDGQHSLAALGGAERHNIPRRECVDCHELPHSNSFAQGVADQLSMSQGLACINCHKIDHSSFSNKGLVEADVEGAEQGMQVTVAQHATSGFLLQTPHDEVTCEECHPADGATFTDRYPGRGADDCQSCHEDPHGGQFDKLTVEGGTFAGGCIACHERQHFAPHAFTVEKHELTALPLDGSHLEVECNDCHLLPLDAGNPQEEGVRVFHGTSAQCDQCHDDAHKGFFDPFIEANSPTLVAELAADLTAHGSCKVCHKTTEFADLGVDAFDHGHWTGFAVLGAHAQMACDRCHPISSTPDTAGRSFGWVSEHFGRYRGCATCHEDPHQGEFDRPSLPQTVDGKTGCARCHVQTSFRTFPQGFDHQQWTGFVVEGAHAEAGCAACHEPLFDADSMGRTWGPAKGKECDNCHDDPHGGQFERRGQTDCRKCHRSSASFSHLSFRHNLDSKFRLGEQHRALDCAACHKVEQKGDMVMVRYKPLPSQCTDCHGSQDDPFNRRKGGRR